MKEESADTTSSSSSSSSSSINIADLPSNLNRKQRRKLLFQNSSENIDNPS